MVFKNMYNCDNCLDFPDRCILLGFLPSLRQSSAISGVINNHGDNQYDRCYFPQKCKHRQKNSAKKNTVAIFRSNKKCISTMYLYKKAPTSYITFKKLNPWITILLAKRGGINFFTLIILVCYIFLQYSTVLSTIKEG